ncbi:hypothetical protein RCL_jg17642.t1 [Rhizophagus clarus]|uniref:Uncharacterized protein n=1 Tax=Rhizophagus clarus TaxID=94130 RepID=A0A8H3L525_9GLOM|nr:hypothetical protein RCL_jg17642.t1 [Rhizophagus clarus]
MQSKIRTTWSCEIFITSGIFSEVVDHLGTERNVDIIIFIIKKIVLGYLLLCGLWLKKNEQLALTIERNLQYYIKELPRNLYCLFCSRSPAKRASQ